LVGSIDGTIASSGVNSQLWRTPFFLGVISSPMHLDEKRGELMHVGMETLQLRQRMIGAVLTEKFNESIKVEHRARILTNFWHSSQERKSAGTADLHHVRALSTDVHSELAESADLRSLCRSMFLVRLNENNPSPAAA
jgi:hypothetical protein